ncbi:MAG: hypothetical protein IV100_21935 [Myxococcales bacterium]|nr:hypothetical protein [Myxococcales bacterium]
MLLVLCEGAIYEDVADSDQPKLADHDFEVVHESPSPDGIPVWGGWDGSSHEHAIAELVEGQLVIAWWQEAMLVEGR